MTWDTHERATGEVTVGGREGQTSAGGTDRMEALEWKKLRDDQLK